MSSQAKSVMRTGANSWLLAILVGVWAIYSNVLHAPWAFDDHGFLTDPVLHPSSLAPAELIRAASGTTLEVSRWLPNLSFALQFYFWGEDSTLAFHVFNVVLHCAVVVFVFLFLRTTLQLAGRELEAAQRISLIAAAIFAFNPLQTQAVTYIWQRTTSMVALFFVAAMWLLAEALRHQGAARRWRLAGAVLLVPVCALTKQNGVMLPFVMAGYAWLFGTERRLKTLGLGLGLMSVVGLLVLFGLVIPFWYKGGSIAASFDQLYATRTFTMSERLLTQPRVVLHLLSLLLLPLLSRMNLDHHVETSTNLFSPWTTLPAIVVVIVLVLLACWCARRRPLMCLGILWWFVLLIPESTIVPLEMMFEHRAYLPSVAVLMLVALGVDDLARRLLAMGVSLRAVSALGCGLLVLLMAGTHLRNEVWGSSLLLWGDAHAKSPDKARTNYNLGYYLEELAKTRPPDDPERRRVMAGADKLLIRGGELGPENAVFVQGASRAFLRQGRFDEAKKALHQVIDFQETASSHVHLGLIHLREEHWTKASEAFRRAITLDATIPEAYYNLACSLARLGQYDQAIDALADALDAGLKYAESIEDEPAFAELREHERFIALVKQHAQ